MYATIDDLYEYWGQERIGKVFSHLVPPAKLYPGEREALNHFLGLASDRINMFFPESFPNTGHPVVKRLAKHWCVVIAGYFLQVARKADVGSQPLYDQVEVEIQRFVASITAKTKLDPLNSLPYGPLLGGLHTLSEGQLTRVPQELQPKPIPPVPQMTSDELLHSLVNDLRRLTTTLPTLNEQQALQLLGLMQQAKLFAVYNAMRAEMYEVKKRESRSPRPKSGKPK